MRIFRVIDFETTGLQANAGIVEIGWTDVFVDNVVSIEPVWHAELCNPGVPIDPEASAVHGIKDEDVKNSPHPRSVLETLKEGVEAFVAHNKAYEQKLWKSSGKPWVCTLKAARKYFPESPGFSNTVLKDYLGHDKIPGFTALSIPAHRAGPDTFVTAHHLKALLEKARAEDLLEVSKGVQLLEICSFRKYAGKKWSQVPHDYMEWLLKLPSLDEDVEHTCKFYLGRLGNDQ